MYITIKSVKKTLGKYIELTDMYLGITALFIFLIMFAFTDLKIESLIFLSICCFLLIPINFSKKNRMYKILGLFIKYLIRNKNYCYFNVKEELKNE